MARKHIWRILIFRLLLIVLVAGPLLTSMGRSVNAVGPYQLVISHWSNRSSAEALDGETVVGDIYVFTTPDTPDITQVKYYLDDPYMVSKPRRTENSAPYDFNGGSVSAATPFATTTLVDGTHTITAAMILSGGSTEVVTATFTVDNTALELVFDIAGLDFSSPIAGPDLNQSVTVDTIDGAAGNVVLTDDVAWLSLTPTSGTSPLTFTVTVKPDALLQGSYNATITAAALGYAPATLPVVLSVPGHGADQIHLAWVMDPATSLTVVWRTQDVSVSSEVQYRVSGETTWLTQTGGPRPSGSAGRLHEVTLTSLTPNSTYEYRVRGTASTWSDIYAANTAPPPGPADFDAIYVADTGLIGRTDRLTQGTSQVIDEIANLNPLLVLPGGDYAYYNTDTRYGTLDNSIDAWFNQMQPIATRSVMMPTYGNHEALLGEGFDAWAARFPTPNGLDNRRNYSFDVGDVHFVSIFAVHGHDPIPTTTIDWIRQDILAAQAAGQRWIIPYFHVSPFADGTNHSSNIALRGQLGPLFESLGVKVVIASHDQSYERTYPLTDVPATNTPTSSSTSCYTMADGVTWVKVSPGGKLSNISRNFSPWGTDPAPAWTAYRDNTMHHFLRIRVAAAGTLRLEAFGVTGTGATPIIQDSFEYTVGSCASGDAPVVAITDPANASTVSGTIPVRVDASDVPDAAGTLTVEVQIDNGTWEPAPYNSTTQRYERNWNTTTVDDGGHTVRARATDSDGLTSATAISVVVDNVPDPGSDYSVMFTQNSNRSNPAGLNGATVAGDIYVFTTPDASEISRVRFYLNDPTMAGNPHRTENSAPYDFMGGTNTKANALNTTTLSDGSHTITAEIRLTSGGTEVIHATFTVQNAPGSSSPPTASVTQPTNGNVVSATVTIQIQASDDEDAVGSLNVEVQIDNGIWTTATYNNGTQRYEYAWNTMTIGDGSHAVNARATDSEAQTTVATPVTVTVDNVPDQPPLQSLVYSRSSSRSDPSALSGATVSGNIYIFTTPDAAEIVRVRFYLDDRLMNGDPVMSEGTPPYDFAGGTVTRAKAFSTRTLSNGQHTITAAVELTNGSTVIVHATFTVQNS